MNYEHSLWALVYDQYNQGRHEHELEFYSQLLQDCSGPVLEVACGTGMILLSLLDRGVDIYGFDISAEMLEVLYHKDGTNNRSAELHQRITRQDMVDFHYDDQFAAIIVPARSFLHLTDQDSQIRCLRNIHAHLKNGGFFALNFFNPNLGMLASCACTDPEYKFYASYSSEDVISGKIDLFYRQVNNIPSQLQHIDWKFITKEGESVSKMQVRWIYTEEFKLLLQLAGFNDWDLYGDFHGGAFDQNSKEMVWVVRK